MVYKYAHNHKLLSKAYPHISIRFVFRPTCRLSDFFLFKDRIPFAMRSHIVACINISVNAVVHCMLVKHADIYTRESQNIWEFRPNLEICSAFSLPNVCCFDSPSSLQTYNVILSLTFNTILTSGNSKFDLEMRESLLIPKLKPVPNNNISSMPLYLF